MNDPRWRRGPWLAVGLLAAALVLSCVRVPPSPEACEVYTEPIATRAAGVEVTLVVVETLVDELGRACAGLWAGCCVPLTATAEFGSNATLPVAIATYTEQPTFTPRPTYTERPTAAPAPTYTPRPTLQSTQGAVASATAQPPLCRRCVPDSEQYGCPGDYVCEFCEECYYLCVPEASPRSGCNFCAGVVIP